MSAAVFFNRYEVQVGTGDAYEAALDFFQYLEAGEGSGVALAATGGRLIPDSSVAHGPASAIAAIQEYCERAGGDAPIHLPPGIEGAALGLVRHLCTHD